MKKEFRALELLDLFCFVFQAGSVNERLLSAD